MEWVSYECKKCGLMFDVPAGGQEVEICDCGEEATKIEDTDKGNKVYEAGYAYACGYHD